MDHVAIMKPSWKLIPKIVSGEKTIESRWYQTRRTPWNKIAVGDIVYFKNSGQPIIAKARVEKVYQYELKDMKIIENILHQYGKSICLVNTNPYTWSSVPKYCILIQLSDAEYITPFSINKKGFGSAAAWLTLDNIEKITQ